MISGGPTPSMSPKVIDKEDSEVPLIDDDEPLPSVVQKLFKYLVVVMSDVPHTFEQFSSSDASHQLRPLITYLSENVHNPLVVCAFMILKYQFSNVRDDDWGQNESRGYACEFAAWQYLTCLSYRETIDFLLRELPPPSTASTTPAELERGPPRFGMATQGRGQEEMDEQSPLLTSPAPSLSGFFLGRREITNFSISDSFGGKIPYRESNLAEQFSRFYGLNALEIAAIVQAKKFLSQKVIQRIIDDIWNGEIVFWDSLSVYSQKKPQIFRKRTADPYSRLRVPAYRKAFEAAFFVSFLALYYALLVERNPRQIGIIEALMYIWISAFAYDELGEITDSGLLFYQTGFWSIWNLGIISTGIAFVIARIVGLLEGSEYITDLSFDILSLEALFLVPRICSLVSLNSYFGILIPVLKEMTKAFLKFMPVVVVLYLGFLTTFTMLARNRFTLTKMSWILVKVLFGSTDLGFSVAREISPIFGSGLMLVFISMTNILLLSSLISLMSMSLEGVMAHAREEYLFHLSIYVLESSSSRRLTYFMPPLNLLPLICLRPLRLAVSWESLRWVRIVLLKITHAPFVAIILAYEAGQRHLKSGSTLTPPINAGTRVGARRGAASRIPLTEALSSSRASIERQSRLAVGEIRGSMN